MKRSILLCFCLFIGMGMYAQQFEEFFQDKTLRIDYLFAGDVTHSSIYLDELSRLPSWAGRRHHLAELPLEGNGQITMRDVATQKCIYQTSFSSLFQEWLSTDEAKETSRGFENSFLLPLPQRPAEVEIVLMNTERQPISRFKHTIQPNDVLIHERGNTHVTPHKYLLNSGTPSNCIDIAILAEGYTENERELFYQDAQKACESLLFYEPFRSMKSNFNIVAVASASKESGVSIPHNNDWKQTAFNAHFDTFYSERYLISSWVKSIHNALAGIPYEHIIIIANTNEYGGGGIYNTFALTAAHIPSFKPVIAHEFGHSFAGLGDEYFDEDDVLDGIYPLHVEAWEPNITTLVDFSSKWKDMLPTGVPIPTPISQKQKYSIGVYKEEGYSSKGIYRPALDCRMRTNEYPTFCPVCQRAIQRMIAFYTHP